MDGFVVSVSNVQKAIKLEPERLGRLEEVGASVLEGIRKGELARCPLPSAVEVSLVDDEAIGKVHGEFMDDPTPTDVITFPYGEFGEILISLETAKRQGEEFKRPLFVEVTLYLIHGILHLAGYNDQQRIEREEMEKIQEELLTQYL